MVMRHTHAFDAIYIHELNHSDVILVCSLFNVINAKLNDLILIRFYGSILYCCAVYVCNATIATCLDRSRTFEIVIEQFGICFDEIS
jgi:hypothetical protein